MKIISDISFWWSIPLLLLSGVIAFLFYNFLKKSTLFSSKIRLLLVILRAAGLFFILLLFLGIFLEYTSYRTEKPLLFVALDESESMLNYADSGTVKTQLPQKIKQLENEFGEKYTLKFMRFGESINDSIAYSFDNKRTNIGAIFEAIHEKYVKRNVGAIILISDGNYNQGINPIYNLTKLNFVPVFTVGIGDTIQKKDLAIQALFANDVAFLGDEFPIQVEGKATHFLHKKAILQLYNGKNLIEKKELNFESDITNFTHTFSVKATGEGYQHYSIKITSGEKENSYINNTKDAYVEILNNRKKILLLSGDIHPDMGAIKSVIEKEKNSETTVNFTSNLTQLPECDLVIWHSPTKPFNQKILDQITASKTPVLFILSPGEQNNQLTSLHLGISGVSSTKKDLTKGIYNDAFSLIEFSDILKKRLSNLPPLNVPFAGNWSEFGSTLLYQELDGIKLQRPLMSFGNIGEQKIGIIYGDGLWRWKLIEFVKYGDNEGFEELISKSLQYLSVKKNTSKLRVFPPENATNQDEIIFKAEFYNDAFQLITDPTIELHVFDENKKELSSSIFSKNDRDYELNLGRFKAGKYTWKANTSFNEKTYDRSGEFVVRDISMENLSLQSNFNLLNELAVQSKGKFFPLNKWDSMIKEIKNRKEITPLSFEQLTMNDLLDYKLLFFLIILIFCLEWTIKRWFGSY